jgi:hypothetical protein
VHSDQPTTRIKPAMIEHWADAGRHRLEPMAFMSTPPQVAPPRRQFCMLAGQIAPLQGVPKRLAPSIAPPCPLVGKIGQVPQPAIVEMIDGHSADHLLIGAHGRRAQGEVGEHLDHR